VSRAAIEQLLYSTDNAFETTGTPADEAHSLLSNLRTVEDDDWLWVAPGAGRRIFDIVRHVGDCKYVYDNHAFGDGTINWDQPGTIPSVELESPRSALIGWLREGHLRWRASIARLDDDDQLLRLRRTNWGELKETRWIIGVMIEHDLYHAGEINHIRALRQGTDRWAWES
jgi:hypothetical protein